jgi:hypothetical protein
MNNTSDRPEPLRSADALDLVFAGFPVAKQAATELRRLYEVNQELLEALQIILNISLMDKGHWAKTIETEAHNAILKATGESK